MATVAGTSKKVNYNAIEKITMGAATTAADGIIFDCSKGRNEEIVLIFQNTDASNAYNMTIKAPAETKRSYAGADTDLYVTSIPAGGIAVARVEKVKYVDTDNLIKLVPSNIAVKAMLVY